MLSPAGGSSAAAQARSATAAALHGAQVSPHKKGRRSEGESGGGKASKTVSHNTCAIYMYIVHVTSVGLQFERHVHSFMYIDGCREPQLWHSSEEKRYSTLYLQTNDSLRTTCSHVELTKQYDCTRISYEH